MDDRSDRGTITRCDWNSRGLCSPDWSCSSSEADVQTQLTPRSRNQPQISLPGSRLRRVFRSGSKEKWGTRDASTGVSLLFLRFLLRRPRLSIGCVQLVLHTLALCWRYHSHNGPPLKEGKADFCKEPPSLARVAGCPLDTCKTCVKPTVSTDLSHGVVFRTISLFTLGSFFFAEVHVVSSTYLPSPNADMHCCSSSN